MTKPLPEALTTKDLAGVVILAGGLSTRMGSPKALLTLPSGETLLDYHLHSAGQLGVPILIADNEQGYRCSINNGDEGETSHGYHISDYQPQSSNPHADLKHSAGPLGAIVAAMLQLLVEPNHNKSGEVPHDVNADMTTTDQRQSQWLLVVSCDSLISASDIWQQLKQWHSLEYGSEQGPKSSLDQSPQLSQAEQALGPKVYCLTDNQRLYPLLGLYQLSVAESLKTYLDAGERRVMAFIKPICQQLLMPEAWADRCNLNTPEQFQQACQSLQSE